MVEIYLVHPVCLKIRQYGKCSKISNNKVSDKMPYANSADADQIDQDLHCLPFHLAF